MWKNKLLLVLFTVLFFFKDLKAQGVTGGVYPKDNVVLLDGYIFHKVYSYMQLYRPTINQLYDKQPYSMILISDYARSSGKLTMITNEGKEFYNISKVYRDKKNVIYVESVSMGSNNDRIDFVFEYNKPTLMIDFKLETVFALYEAKTVEE